ncbi:hypothetical protein [Sulfobacillus harzensis]|uniref:Uncharacterized protein n=1 Tax=Sulfobacillus harzensis TaxID=2729629 RepID=A0A7Y0L7E3_9FIRM|nr:hypothetical protein [Sulfobacillus harzensis]NMP24595.1 hypothetical protein [Sulfobacillus harzensis]
MIKKITSTIAALAVFTLPILADGISQAAALPRSLRLAPVTSIPQPPVNAPVVGPGAGAPPSSFPLSLTQLQTTINTVNAHLAQAPNGTVSVSVPVLRQAGLTGPEIAWTQQAIRAYDQKIASGQIRPIIGAARPYSLASTPQAAITLRPLSTYGLDYTWYIARTPYWYTVYFWWGNSKMANNSATKNLVRNLNAIASGAGIASLFSWEGSWIAGLGSLVIGAYANQISSTNARGGYYGVHLNFVLGNPIPVGIYANIP